LESFALAGNSMGGTWALWYALAHSERVRALVLLGSAPLLPGTRVPTPLRVSAAPVVGDLLKRVVKPNPKLVARLMSSMGEKDTIVRYPDLIDALVAAGKDPTASAVNLAELRAAISSFGFRRSMRIHPDELRSLTVPTLLIWGDHDPVGAVGVAERTARLIPTAQLEVLPAGHVPYLGHPEQVARRLSSFVRREEER
jgi:pimeloyl-ACP methyl ester carboxylesterase